MRIHVDLGQECSDAQATEISEYLRDMPIVDILAGLKFSRRRLESRESGTLRVGRKSIVQREVHSVTQEQAEWRLANWKLMIANYRKRGYSYPTISRIKKELGRIAK